jgi:microfibrillar-associated protein 1
MSSSNGKQAARVARAATRYRPGKAPTQIGLGERYSSDEDDDEGTQQSESGPSVEKRQAATVISTGDGSQIYKSMEVKLQPKSEIVPEQEDESSEYETDTDEEPAISNKPVFRKPGTAPLTHTNTAKKASSSEYETDSEEEDSSSEDDRPQLVKPIFIPKNKRGKESEQGIGQQEIDTEKDAEDKARKEAEIRKKQSHMMAAERIRQELQEKEYEEALPDLSDTDDKDPEGEFAAWRIRELTRIKREREIVKAKEEERAEIERRRAMPEEERMREDLAKVAASRSEKERQRKDEGQQGFMQKYYHKGSFFQDMDILNNRNYSAMTESATDKKSLPSVMQVRDYGKKGRSKWTHLANEDTSRPRQEDSRFKGMSGVKDR